MGFTKANPKDDTEVADEKKEFKTNVVPITTEVILKNTSDCCKSCQRNKYFAVLQGLFNVALIVLIIILFVMVNNLKSNIDDGVLPIRTKRLNDEEPLKRDYSVRDNVESNSKNIKSTQPPIPTQRSSTKEITTKETKFLTKLDILDTVVDPNLMVRPGRQSYRRKLPSSEKPKLENLTLANGTQCTCIGQTGPEGASGRTGRRGRKGKKGNAGPQGPMGPQGQPGNTGKTGKAGPRGDVGTIGLPGPIGEKGGKGDPGRASIQDLPVVHATGFQFLAPLREMPKGILKNWQYDDDLLTIVNGKIEFSQGFITIKEYGFYHVYSQVFFQADQAGVDPHLCHYVYFFRKHKLQKHSTKSIILRGFATTPKHTKAGQAFYTTSASGVFRLMPGDQLAMGVDPVHMPLISYAESATYFGAYMI